MERSFFHHIAALGVAAALLGLAACDAVEPAGERQLVVEAFVQVGAPLDTLVLRQAAPRASGGAAAEAAARARVEVQVGEQVVAYREDAQRPGRYVPGQTLTAPPGARLRLSAQWEGQHAQAESRVPVPITLDSARLSVPEAPVEAVLLDSLRLDLLGVPAEVGLLYPIEVELWWTAPPAAERDTAAWIRTRLRPVNAFSSTVTDFFLQPEDVFPEREAATDEAADRRRWTGVYAVPVDQESDPLPIHRLEVALVRSGATYARFAATRNDPARREPLSNIDGGLGIFAGIALDTLHLRVAP